LSVVYGPEGPGSVTVHVLDNNVDPDSTAVRITTGMLFITSYLVMLNENFWLESTFFVFLFASCFV
jgi:hypothetical protein